MQTISIPSIPASVEEFISIRNQIATSPEGGAAVFVLAMILFDRDEKLGVEALTVALDRSNLREDMNGYKGFSPGINLSYHIDRFSRNSYWGRAYIEGTSPENQYTLPPVPLQLSIGRNSYSEQKNGDVKVFIKCSGADNPRPISMRVNDKGLWKAVECSSMFLGMRAPEQEISDDL
jgi:hypothetical protein